MMEQMIEKVGQFADTADREILRQTGKTAQHDPGEANPENVVGEDKRYGYQKTRRSSHCVLRPPGTDKIP
jgi:hypothetical protein